MMAAGAEAKPRARMADEIADPDQQLSACATASGTFKISVTRNIEDVETAWRALTVSAVESPGQSYDFIRLWILDRNISRDDQRFVIAHYYDRPIALLPLYRRRISGVIVYTWFPGSHVGCYTPISEHAALVTLGPSGREALWRAMVGELKDADALYLRSLPRVIDGQTELFSELGTALAVETLYRSQFSSWEECDKIQRSRSRRKHDRQQSDKLAALGKISFEVVADPVAGTEALKVMFQQRAARFRSQGLRDVFHRDDIIRFYHKAIRPDSGLDVRLHVLRLDGDIVAVRYSIVHAQRMFCLISSMSDDPNIQVGSPGKQCLLRVMQSVFDGDLTMFDMGQGFTDEKRHWCNVQMPLRHHYIAITWRGVLAIYVHQAFQRLRMKAKASSRIRRTLRQIRQLRTG